MVRLGIESGLILKNPLIIRRTLTGLEVENKSATPYSSRRAREGPEKMFLSFSFLSSTFLDPSENLRRMDKATHKEMANSEHK